MQKLKLHWGSIIASEGIGNNLGYWTHTTTLKRYLDMNPEVEFCDDAKDTIIITSPDFFTRKIEGKKNWLFTMFEGTTLPDPYVTNLKKADYLLAPSTWVKNLFLKYFPDKKVFVINHGVERDFRFRQRTFPKTIPFQYLWVGAPNPRKGYEYAMMTWKEGGFINDPNIRLYVKTTSRREKPGVEKRGNVIYDDRKLSQSELIELYRHSHCLVVPRLAEGFDLVLAEGMRTGIPAIATYYSGVTDFFNNDVGYPIGYRMIEGKQQFFRDGKEGTEYKTMLAQPCVDELAFWMHYIRYNYNEALEKGKKASELISNRFTWERAVKELINAVRSVQNER